MKLTCEFDRAQYLTGQEIRLYLPEGVNAPRVCVYRLETPVDCSVRQSGRTLTLPPLPVGSYGVAVEAGSAQWEGAFDVVEDSRQVTRYAFLSDFTSADTETQDVDWLRRLHFNAVQFYDWMYRHDMLLPPQERYLDPMGRETDLAAIRAKIAACKAAGIRPIAYGAVYAAAKELFAAHPEWAMYTMDGQAMTFAGWLYYMNIAPSCGWSEHILAEFRKAVAFGFSGIHMDTYGFPKQVWDAERRPVELTDALPKLIDRAAEAVRKEDSAAGVIFNAVNNWPMEAVAGTKQDAVYIEVWPPNDRYYDLYTLIREARLCSGKQVVLAAYLHPFQQADTDGAERAFRLSWAAISAAGGTQLVRGENKAALQDSYYANYASLRASFLPVVQRYCDFLVRYAALLYLDAGMDIGRTAAGGINEEVQFEAEDCVFSTDAEADTVWSMIRESGSRLNIQLVNLRGNNARWNEAKAAPKAAENIRIHVRLDRPVAGAFAASPDGESLCAERLPLTCRQTPQGRIYTAELARLDYWAAVWFTMGEEVC